MKTPEQKFLNLMARYSDPASTESEKEMAFKMAQRLIIEHGIIPNVNEEEAEIFYYLIECRVSLWKTFLAASVAKFLGAVGCCYPGCIYFICYPSQRDVIFTYMDFFVKAIEIQTKSACKGKGRSYSNSYKQGITSGIIERLSSRLPESMESKALVLLETHEKIKKNFGVEEDTVEVGVNIAYLYGVKDSKNISDPNALKSGSESKNKISGYLPGA